MDEEFWWDNVCLTIEEIKTFLNNTDIQEISEPFPDIPTSNRLNTNLYNKEWHVGRIKYFINHPEKITPISIDNDCSGGLISGIPIILDGHHRLIASIIRNDINIKAYYSGLISTLDYLTGLTSKLEDK